jgi:uncharacterized protein
VPLGKLLFVAGVFFLTSAVSVVTGSTSLVTVPLLIAFGIEPHVAVATNMLALVFLSLGASLSFIGRSVIVRGLLPLSTVLTVVGSAVGALLLLDIPTRALQLTIAVAMIAIAIFSLFRHNSHAAQHPVTSLRRTVGCTLTFALAVYGGLFSGGYVTVLTAVLVFFFGLSFLQSVATTKVINLFSSIVATGVFAFRGLVDYKLAVVLGISMFFGALLGGKIALRLPTVWLRQIFVVAVVVLAVRMLLHLTR